MRVAKIAVACSFMLNDLGLSKVKGTCLLGYLRL